MVENNKKIKWVRITTRAKNFCVLIMGSVAYGFQSKTSERIFGYLNPDDYRQFNNSRWFSENYINSHLKELEKISRKNLSRLFKTALKYEGLIVSLLQWSKKYRNKNFKNETNLELVKLWREFFRRSNLAFGDLYGYIFVNKFLPDKLTNIIAQKEPDFNKQNQYLKILFSLDKPSETRREKENLLKIARLIKIDRVKMAGFKLDGLINRHLKQFGYLGRYFYIRLPYTKKDIILRLRNFLKKDIDGELKNLSVQKKIPALSRRIIKKLHLDKKTILLIRTIKEWGYAGNCFDEFYTKVIDNLDNLLKETVQRLKINHKELIEMTPQEILTNLRKGSIDEELKNKIKERLKESAVIYERGRIKVLSGRDLKKYYKEELKSEKVISRIKELIGQPASPGQVRGKVHLVLAIEEIKKVKRGEILVASATTPAYVPAMEKASAIVTDEGGLLSHAAIVSRELGIPCIVGTKIATKALKDGDLVEVDAERGVVKIVKRFNIEV